MRPEVLEANSDQGYDGEKADIWSTGVMLYAAMAGRYPFDSSIPQEHRLIMMRGPLQGLPADLSAECKDLLESLLHPDPEARITVAATKQHPLFAGPATRCCRYGGRLDQCCLALQTHNTGG